MLGKPTPGQRRPVQLSRDVTVHSYASTTDMVVKTSKKKKKEKKKRGENNKVLYNITYINKIAMKWKEVLVPPFPPMSYTMSRS